MTAARNSTPECPICGHPDGSAIEVKEMMFGTGVRYSYVVCAGCGCARLRDEIDASAHYPAGYDPHRVHPRPTGFRGLLRHLRNLGLFRGNPVGRMLNRLAPYPVYGAGEWMRHLGARVEARILDVGCGSGELLRDLRDAGFTRVEGADPFVPEPVAREIGIHPKNLAEMTGEYDVVMLHHVLEHLPDQLESLRHVARLLRAEGQALIRVPVIGGEAWRRYGVHWVQLDAPRHLFIHTERSLLRIAAAAGLISSGVEYDSTEFQFTGSELYARGIPLTQLSDSYSSAALRKFRGAARRLNRERRGDQAVFYFRKAGSAS
jgi:SAM-dependent methyltransferase